MVDLLRKLATQHEARNTLTEAIQTVRRLLDLEPWQEESHRWLMELLAKNGQRSAALAHFEVCQRVLQAELAVAPSEETVQLVAQIRNAEYATDASKQNSLPKTSEHTRHNLPQSITPFLGRTQECDNLYERIQQDRLLTLIGPPGVGKTRLATEVGQRLREAFTDGVWFVSLAPVHELTQVALVTCQVLGLQESGLTALERLTLYLREKHLLLILDNFEQLLAHSHANGVATNGTSSNGAAKLEWINQLLTACPLLHLLVTSRAPLRLRAERQSILAPLELPTVTETIAFERLSSIPALKLFVERAQAVQPDFVITPQNVNDIANICIRLDGLPLAIELVAARCKLLSPALLLERLNRRLLLNSTGLRDTPAHQQTLYHAIQWSYELLTADEQTLFLRLAVFAGGFTLEAAEAICVTSGEEAQAVFDGLASLLDKNLITRRADEQGNIRFGMLSLIQEFALEKLEKLDSNIDAAGLHAAHADYYVTWAEAADARLRTAEQLTWFEQVTNEQHNFRAVLQWSGQTENDTRLGLRLVKALGWFWYIRSNYGEGIRWGERLLEVAATKEHHLLTAWVHSTIALLATGLDDFDRGLRSGQQALNVADALHNVDLRAHVVQALVTHLYCRGDFQRARQLVQETLEQVISRQQGTQYDQWTLANLYYLAIRVCEDGEQARHYWAQGQPIANKVGDRWLMAAFICNQEHFALEAGELSRGIELGQQYHQLSVALQDTRNILFSLLDLAGYAYRQADYELATSHCNQGFEKAIRTGTPGMIASFFHLQGHIAYHRSQTDEALSHYAQAIHWVKEINHNFFLAITLPAIARIVAERGLVAESMRLIGAAEALYPLTQLDYDPDLQPIVEAAHKKLINAAFAIAWAEGNKMTLNEAIDYALTLCA